MRRENIIETAFALLMGFSLGALTVTYMKGTDLPAPSARIEHVIDWPPPMPPPVLPVPRPPVKIVRRSGQASAHKPAP